MGIPDHLTYLLRNLYADQEAAEPDMKQQTDFKLGKEYVQTICCHPVYLTSIQSPGIWNARLDDSQAGIKIMGRNINNFRYADDTILMEESKEELNSLLTMVKEEHEKAGLKLNIQKTKIMASSPITSWQKDGETMETVTDYFSIFLGC